MSFVKTKETVIDDMDCSISESTLRDQYMNAMFKNVGAGAMTLAASIQNIHKPGERLAAAMFFLKCIIDNNHLPLSDLLDSAGRMEVLATQHQAPELAGARAYIENDFLKHD